MFAILDIQCITNSPQRVLGVSFNIFFRKLFSQVHWTLIRTKYYSSNSDTKALLGVIQLKVLISLWFFLKCRLE